MQNPTCPTPLPHGLPGYSPRRAPGIVDSIIGKGVIILIWGDSKKLRVLRSSLLSSAADLEYYRRDNGYKQLK